MNLQTVALYVLRALAEAQIHERSSNLESIVSDIQVRKRDVRAVLTSLHREGYVDVLRMRLTLRGFAVGRALLGKELPELRPAQAVAQKAEPEAAAVAPAEAARGVLRALSRAAA